MNKNLFKKVLLLLATVLLLNSPVVIFASDLNNFKKSNSFDESIFEDVRVGDWYYGSVKSCYEMGLFKGKSDGIFDAKGNITLSEAMTLACRMHNIYYNGESEISTDEEALKYAVDNNLINPLENTYYDRYATKLELAAMFSKVLPATELNMINNVYILPNIGFNTQMYNDLINLYRAGIVTGVDEYGTFGDTDYVTRAEVVGMIDRMLIPQNRIKKEFKIQYLSDEQKNEDLEYLCDTLETNHKNIYHTVSKEEFIKAKEKIKTNIHNMTDTEFFIELKQLVAMIGDAHTSIDYNFNVIKYEYMKALPFAVIKLEDKWHMAMITKESEMYLGYEVLAINDCDINEIFNRSAKITSHENETWLASNFSNTINFADNLKFLDVIDDLYSITLKLKDSKGQITELDMTSLSGDEIFSSEIVSLENKIPPTGFMSNKIYHYMKLDEDTLFIQYNACMEDKDLPMADFVSLIEKEITNNKYSKIIVDLRYNSGGNSAVFSPMIAKLKEIKNEYELGIYTLIGSQTFSSGVMNAVQLKQDVDSVLVGSPTGGNVNGYGEIKYFNLVNSPMTIYYSTNYFVVDANYEKDSLYPDINVKSIFDEYMNGIDCDVNTVMEIK